MDIGVYEIVCLPTGQRYIGGSVTLRKRRTHHKWQLRNGIHHSRHLQQVWDIYGEDSFEFRPLLFCSREMLRFFEQRALDILCPELNVLPLAEGVAGYEWTLEQREKQRRMHKEKILPKIDQKAHAQKVSAAWERGVYAEGMRAKSRLYEYDGESMTVKEAAVKYGINPNTLAYRLYKGMSFADAITTPVDHACYAGNHSK